MAEAHDSDLVAAHAHSSGHADELKQCELAGCFYCCSTFPPGEIREWIKESRGGETAICPRCGIDAVIGSAAGFQLTPAFLTRMKEYWFDR